MDTASGKDQWRGSSCSFNAHHVSSSAAVAGLKAGRGFSRSAFCDTGTYMLRGEGHGQASNISRWWASSISAQAAGPSQEEGRLNTCSLSLTQLPASKGMVQEQEVHYLEHQLPSCGLWRPWQDVCRTTASEDWNCSVWLKETIGRDRALGLCNPGVKSQTPISSLHLPSFLKTG